MTTHQHFKALLEAHRKIKNECKHQSTGSIFPVYDPPNTEVSRTSTCYWFWSSPAARSAWHATLPAPPWPSPSTPLPACENSYLRSRGRRVPELDRETPEEETVRKIRIVMRSALPSTSSLSLCSSLHLRRLSGSA